MEKQYVTSERAHYMCPNMHFGIMITIEATYSLIKVRETIERISEAHPFLNCLMQYEDGSSGLFYSNKNKIQAELCERESVQMMWDDYKEIGKKSWNIFEQGLLKVLIYPLAEGFKVLFVAHHLLGDGRCLLELDCEFADAYVEGKVPVYVKENLIKGIEDLPDQTELTGISRLLVHRLNRKWKKENRIVTYKEYIDFSEEFVRNNPVSFKVSSIDVTKINHLKKLCKENNITINDFIMASIYVKANTNKIIIAADIRNKLKCYKKGSFGNYATAIGIVCNNKSQDIITKAKSVHNKVQKTIRNNRKLMLVLSCYLTMEATLIDATAIATLGKFNSKAAKFVGGSMFGFGKRDGISVTNLGAVNSPNMKEAIFIPPASPATSQTIGVLTINNTMQLCISYYERSNSKEKVEGILEGLFHLG